MVHNFTTGLIELKESGATLGIGAVIRDSSVTSGLYMEKYSGLTRSKVFVSCSIGSFSYVSDSNLSPYCHIGTRT